MSKDVLDGNRYPLKISQRLEQPCRCCKVCLVDPPGCGRNWILSIRGFPLAMFVATMRSGQLKWVMFSWGIVHQGRFFSALRKGQHKKKERRKASTMCQLRTSPAPYYWIHFCWLPLVITLFLLRLHCSPSVKLQQGGQRYPSVAEHLYSPHT